MRTAKERQLERRNPRAARINFLILRAASQRRAGDVRAEAYSAAGGGGGGASGGSGGGGGGGGSFNQNFESNQV